MAAWSFALKPLPPFRLDWTAWALQRRPGNVIDRWDGREYRRVLMLAEQPVEVRVSQSGSAESPQLRVTVWGGTVDRRARSAIADMLRRVLGLRVDLSEFYQFANGRPRLAAAAERFRGMKPPRFPTLFETLVNGVACQQLSLSVGLQLLARLSQEYSRTLQIEGRTNYAFPLAAELATAQMARLRTMGFSRHKAKSIIEIARAACDDGWNADNWDEDSDEEVIERLRGLRGVGPWTAQYTLLRGLGRLHIFPAADSGAQRGLRRWLDPKNVRDETFIARRMARWSRFGGMVYFHLLLQGLAERGMLS